MERTLALAFLVAGCVPEPPLRLRDTMLLQEIELGRLERSLEDGAPREEVLEAARAMTELNAQKAFDDYASRSDVRDRADEFRAFVAELRSAGAAIVDDLEAGEDAAESVARLRASCDACHAVFRPGY